jgi:hypothetical protein
MPPVPFSPSRSHIGRRRQIQICLPEFFAVQQAGAMHHDGKTHDKIRKYRVFKVLRMSHFQQIPTDDELAAKENTGGMEKLAAGKSILDLRDCFG